jgi:hypothetical protein
MGMWEAPRYISGAGSTVVGSSRGDVVPRGGAVGVGRVEVRRGRGVGWVPDRLEEWMRRKLDFYK